MKPSMESGEGAGVLKMPMMAMTAHTTSQPCLRPMNAGRMSQSTRENSAPRTIWNTGASPTMGSSRGRMPMASTEDW
ncbi:hypothetical protein GPA_01480 [Gordonibacter pamelaeae 7-10-1-b]|uniref:Uncharacterized protein n=1 Tax=Gordonibacter pamelaeae 7-10-1-b TaxID=657308 RepID=D6E6F8_9ACTN|nr:hypothetical protein GPA_01480 [Gordonibacter pamelaeae 7-10-1-b]